MGKQRGSKSGGLGKCVFGFRMFQCVVKIASKKGPGTEPEVGLRLCFAQIAVEPLLLINPEVKSNRKTPGAS